jgi:hypothetical protein
MSGGAIEVLNREVSELRAILEGEGVVEEVIDLARLKRRNEALARLRELLTGVRAAAGEMSRLGQEAEARVRAEVDEARARLEEASGEKKGPAGAGAEARPPRGAPAREPALPALPAPVEVAAGLTLPARVLSGGVHTPEGVLKAATEAGGLIYAPAWNHFAVSVGGLLLHANVGEVYYGPPQEGTTAVRIKECRRADCRKGPPAPDCMFYHDPEKYRGSSEVRNFLASGWVYGRENGRVYGSKPHLMEDIRGLDLEEAAKFKAQVAHDLICLLLLERYGPKGH